EMRRRVLLAFEAAEREPDIVRQRRYLTFVIVGGGPTGVELAGALAEIAGQSLRRDFRNIQPESASIVLIESGPNLLAPFPDRLQQAARRSLEHLGVRILTGSLVIGIDAEGVTWRPSTVRPGATGPSDPAAETSQRIEAHTVLWAAGVAASPLAQSLGVPLDRVGRVSAE